MTYDNALRQFEKLFNNELSEAEAKALLVQLYERGETPEEVTAAATVMRAHSISVEVEDSLKEQLIDVVGTGGDHIGSFNISSTVALIVSAFGIPVAKHGSRSATSKSGSADMYEALGINLNLQPPQQVQLLKECGFTFLFAQNHHPAMKYIMPIRKSLSHRTIFNILGPLCNPADVKKIFLGVFDKNFIPHFTYALDKLGTKEAMVVSGRDGMDEISISDISYGAHLKGGKISEFEIDPQQYGLKLYDQKQIVGGDAEHNAHITRELLANKLEGAKRDIILINAAGAFLASGEARDMQEGIEMTKEVLQSGKALHHLEKIIKISNGL